jgi:hypothetical protein
LANTEKEVAEAILRAGGLSASKCGLRFDRVAVGLLGDLRAFADATIPADAALIATLSAPIRLPAKTLAALKREIAALVSRDAPRGDTVAAHGGNDVRLRLVESLPKRPLSLIGFVHNADARPEPLLDLAEHWLRPEAAGLNALE